MSKQKFKGRTFYTKTIVDNIIRIFDQADAPTNWYNDANEFAAGLAAKHNYTLAKICGVIAALSPLKSWDENKNIVKIYLKTGRCKHTGVMKDKAAAILAGTGEVAEICEILNGNKITSFFINILYPQRSDAVTIDRHALAIALGRNIKDNEAQITDKQYDFFVNCYKVAAEQKNVVPAFIQSATWEKWRELKNAKKYEEVPF